MQVGFFFWPFTPELVRQMAQATERVRIALCVSNLEARHPAASAAAIASLDLLAPGRAILGLGTGHSGTRNIGLGRSPIAGLTEGAQFIRALLRGEPASWRDGLAHLPWVMRPGPVFLSASG